SDWTRLSLDNLSSLYRCVTLARLANIPQTSIGVFLSVFPQVYSDPLTTLQAFHDWQNLSNAGLTIQQIRYIINNSDNSTDQTEAVADTDLMKAVQSLHS